MTTTSQCPQCHRYFTPTNAVQKFCTSVCSSRFHGKQHRSRGRLAHEMRHIQDALDAVPATQGVADLGPPVSEEEAERRMAALQAEREAIAKAKESKPEINPFDLFDR